MHERFRYGTGNDLLQKAKELGLELPWSDDLSPLFQPYNLDGNKIPNRLAVQPMEAHDSENDGSPSELTRRRYLRYASGGSGIKLLNIAMGSPYHNPHVSRPYDTPVPGSKVPGEHPLRGVMRMINGTALVRWY
ncbi:MAG TPA: hypothetical protein DDW27_12075 [Bacteroidales bacterium]|nr:hypothetical protein [Bacteroidales bacterium]